jgi:hypothetical protein
MPRRKKAEITIAEDDGEWESMTPDEDGGAVSEPTKKKVKSEVMIADVTAPSTREPKVARKFSAWFLTFNPNVPFPPEKNAVGETPHPQLMDFCKLELWLSGSSKGFSQE